MKAKNAFAANQNNAEPLGFKLGFTPLSAVREKDDDMQEDGYSKWTDGKKFISKGTVHNIEGAKSITYIYNEEDLLDVVIIVMHKDYFSKVKQLPKKQIQTSIGINSACRRQIRKIYTGKQHRRNRCAAP
jgi:hypothetical protein